MTTVDPKDRRQQQQQQQPRFGVDDEAQQTHNPDASTDEARAQKTQQQGRESDVRARTQDKQQGHDSDPRARTQKSQQQSHDPDARTEEVRTPETRTDERAKPAEEQAPVASRTRLFEESEVAQYRSQWRELQAGFVDEPRGAVREAETLVSQMMDSLTAQLKEQKQALAGNSDAGDTEQLRVVMQRYRSLFDQMLQV